MIPELSQEEQARLDAILNTQTSAPAAISRNPRAPLLIFNRRVLIVAGIIFVIGFSATLFLLPRSTATNATSTISATPGSSTPNPQATPTTVSRFGNFLGNQTRIQDFTRTPTSMQTSTISATALYSGEIATNLLGKITGKINDGTISSTTDANIQGIPSLPNANTSVYKLQTLDITGKQLSQTPIATKTSGGISFTDPGSWQVYLSIPQGTNAIQLIDISGQALDTIYVDTTPTQMIIGPVSALIDKNATITLQTSTTSLVNRGTLHYKLINIDTRRVIDLGDTTLSGSTQSYSISLSGLPIPITSRWIVEVAILTPFFAQYSQSNQFVVEVK